MKCPICNEEIGTASAGRFGPEFAHKTCIIAFKHGQIDGQETEREAIAQEAKELGGAITVGAILSRSNYGGKR